MIIDCFTFYNELGMLKYRLDLLYPIVDKFILVEATTTFMGNSKELYYQKNKALYEKYADKIIHIIVDDMPDASDPWKPENHQRRCISRGFANLELTDSDLIIVSDLDEIPNPTLLLNVKESGLQTMHSLKQDFYYYNLNTFTNALWVHPKIFPYSFYKTVLNSDTNSCRLMNAPVLKNGGWHLSYFGDSKFISNKIKNFAHKEYNSDAYTNEQFIENCLKNGINLFGSNKFEIISFDKNPNLPPNYVFLLESLKIISL